MTCRRVIPLANGVLMHILSVTLSLNIHDVLTYDFTGQWNVLYQVLLHQQQGSMKSLYIGRFRYKLPRLAFAILHKNPDSYITT